MIKKTLLSVSCLFLLACSEEPSSEATAADTSSNVTIKEFNAPEGAPILTISGAISQLNAENSLLLDRSALLAFEQHEVKTTTIWTDGVSTFSGPLVRDVLKAAGNSASKISAVAINEYNIDIPVADTHNYSVIFALNKDGKPLSVREKGPIWVIYPWSSDEKLRQDKYYGRSIWQLNRINLHD